MEQAKSAFHLLVDSRFNCHITSTTSNIEERLRTCMKIEEPNMLKKTSAIYLLLWFLVVPLIYQIEGNDDAVSSLR